MDVAYGATVDGRPDSAMGLLRAETPEKWRLDVTSTINGVNYYEVVNMNSGKCLDVPNGSTARGVELQQWTCWERRHAAVGAVPSRHQLRGPWRKPQERSFAWMTRIGVARGASLQQWDCNELAVQTWQFS